LKFQLAPFEQPEGSLEIIAFSSGSANIIGYSVQGLQGWSSKCDLNDMEEHSLENFGQWDSVKYLLDFVYVSGTRSINLKVSHEFRIIVVIERSGAGCIKT
jgi:hypothetical protein